MKRLAVLLVVIAAIFPLLGLVDNPATRDFEVWGVVYGATVLALTAGGWPSLAMANARPVPWLLTGLTSIVAIAAMIAMFSYLTVDPSWVGIGVGALLLLSPVIDGHCGASAPWMQARWTISFGVGLLTAISGILA